MTYTVTSHREHTNAATAAVWLANDAFGDLEFSRGVETSHISLSNNDEQVDTRIRSLPTLQPYNISGNVMTELSSAKKSYIQ